MGIGKNLVIKESTFLKLEAKSFASSQIGGFCVFASTQYLHFFYQRRVIYSIIYNFLVVTAACLGYVTPLIAAVIMPISSLISLALIGGKKYA